MCGIVGFLGHANGREYLLQGLKKLEYRGYDSAGIGCMVSGDFQIIKAQGKLTALADKYLLQTETKQINIGIGHTRWATHGVPSVVNSHPIKSFTGRFAMVHNGIIENYYQLKEILLKQEPQISFLSQTDTEVFASYLDYKLNGQSDFLKLLPQLLSEIKGSFATLFMDREYSQRLWCIRRKSPMVLGIDNSGDYYLASDANAFPEQVSNYAFLPDNSCMRLDLGLKPLILDINNGEYLDLNFLPCSVQEDRSGLGNYEHYMLKEIREQPGILRALYTQYGADRLSDLGLKAESLARLKDFDAVCLVGCGTSFHAAKFGEYIFESLGIQTFSESGGEYKYRNLPVSRNTLYIFLSQSGETADIITTLEKVRTQGGYTIGITNVMQSALCFLVDDVIFMQAGPEISVASTKAFTSQLALLLFLANCMARVRKHNLPLEEKLFSELANIDILLETYVFNQIPHLKQIALSSIAKASVVLFVGRNLDYPIALEGALKLKEISYINCWGMPIGELKHGSLALVDENTLVIAMESRLDHYEKFVSNVQEVLARGGKVIMLHSDAMRTIEHENVISLTYSHQHYWINGIMNVILLQLLAYYTALGLDVDIDRPRNLAKSVTVE